ncbi:hypothetical protein FHU29_002531 [Hoyosella altamirensis]|uniref:Uncharacterized protein n=1 Tax=Hoyosella altamirensis TaxID=616997 RepID=A0A839RMD2_9ACTN|nr:hypothetical protein [Hoyosella altamirensis]
MPDWLDALLRWLQATPRGFAETTSEGKCRARHSFVGWRSV